MHADRHVLELLVRLVVESDHAGGDTAGDDAVACADGLVSATLCTVLEQLGRVCPRGEDGVRGLQELTGLGLDAGAGTVIVKAHGGNVGYDVLDAKPDCFLGDGPQGIASVCKAAGPVDQNLLDAFVIGIFKEAAV